MPGEAEFQLEGGSHESLVKAELNPTRVASGIHAQRSVLAVIQTQHGRGTIGASAIKCWWAGPNQSAC